MPQEYLDASLSEIFSDQEKEFLQTLGDWLSLESSASIHTDADVRVSRKHGRGQQFELKKGDTITLQKSNDDEGSQVELQVSSSVCHCPRGTGSIVCPCPQGLMLPDDRPLTEQLERLSEPVDIPLTEQLKRLSEPVDRLNEFLGTRPENQDEPPFELLIVPKHMKERQLELKNGDELEISVQPAGNSGAKVKAKIIIVSIEAEKGTPLTWRENKFSIDTSRV
jgi:hypothetical protein